MILFPAWLIVIHTLVITLPLWWLFAQFNANVAGLFAAYGIGLSDLRGVSMPPNTCRRTTADAPAVGSVRMRWFA